MSSAFPDEPALRQLYHQMLDGWNKRDAAEMANVFAADGEVIGFDGSQMRGREEIAATLAVIFASHPTPPYVAKVRAVRPLGPGVAQVSAVVGMVPPGKSDIDPGLNSHQTVIAVKGDGRWEVALLQNTPAQFHGRPELVRSLTEELRQLL